MRKLLLRRATEEDMLPYPGTPRWVKVFGIIALVLALLVGIMLLAGGEHGPGRHIPPASVTEDHTPPIEHGVQPP